ncbi:MAG: sugar nucleotide-binding protein [Eubacteriales bacterium]
MSQKILITGASGFLASRIVQHHQSTYDLLTPTHSQMDISNFEQCISYFLQHKPHYVLHCAAISNTATCEENESRTEQINVIGVENIVRACHAIHAKLIFTSSDQVYHRSTMDRLGLETDILSPRTVYARQKLSAEQEVLRLTDGVCLRLPWMCDRERDDLPPHPDFFSNLSNAIKKQKDIFFSPYDYRSITNVNDIAKEIIKTLELPHGIYNFAATGYHSAYEIAKQLEVPLSISFGLKASNCVQKQLDATPQNGRNITMDMKKILSHKIYLCDTISSIEKLI